MLLKCPYYYFFATGVPLTCLPVLTRFMTAGPAVESMSNMTGREKDLELRRARAAARGRGRVRGRDGGHWRHGEQRHGGIGDGGIGDGGIGDRIRELGRIRGLGRRGRRRGRVAVR